MKEKKNNKITLYIFIAGIIIILGIIIGLLLQIKTGKSLINDSLRYYRNIDNNKTIEIILNSSDESIKYIEKLDNKVKSEYNGIYEEYNDIIITKFKNNNDNNSTEKLYFVKNNNILKMYSGVLEENILELKKEKYYAYVVYFTDEEIKEGLENGYMVAENIPTIASSVSIEFKDGNNAVYSFNEYNSGGTTCEGNYTETENLIQFNSGDSEDCELVADTILFLKSNNNLIELYGDSLIFNKIS